MFQGHYNDWRSSRLNFIKEHFENSFFKNKTMLEVGCGHGDVGSYFQNLGADVTSCDGRAEHVTDAKQKYPNLKVMVFDADSDLLNENYDIIVHWGLLYHLENIDEHLKNICEHCTYLFLETLVSDSTDPFFKIKTTEEGYDQSMSGHGTIPSPAYVERLLHDNNFQFTIIENSKLNSNFHVYDSPIQNTGAYDFGMRKFWICTKVSGL